MHRVSVYSVVVVIGLLAFAPDIVRSEDAWWGPDKTLHLGAGALAGAASYGILYWGEIDGPGTRAILSSIFGTLPGVVKEIYDAAQDDNHFCGKDLMWTAIGATAISLALFGLEMALRGGSSDADSVQRYRSK